MMDDQQAPAGWYTMPSGQRRYWDGQGWGQTEQEAWEESGPMGTAVPLDPPQNVQSEESLSFPIEPNEWTREDQKRVVDRTQDLAWGWACGGLLLTPLAIGGIVKNSQARRMGEPYGIEVGYGPAIMAWVILGAATLFVLALLGGWSPFQQSATPGRAVASSSAGGWSCSEYAADPEGTVAKAARASNSTLQETRNRLAAVCG